MSEYTEVERPFSQRLAELGGTVIDQGTGIPLDFHHSENNQFLHLGIAGSEAALAHLGRCPA